MRIASSAVALIVILCLNAGCATPMLWDLGKHYEEGEPIIIDGAALTEHHLVLAYHAELPVNQFEKEPKAGPQHWATIDINDLTKDPQPVHYTYPEYSYPTTDPITSSTVVLAKVAIVPVGIEDEACVEDGEKTDNCLGLRKLMWCHTDKLEGILVFQDSSGITRKKELELPTPGQEFRKLWAYPVVILLTPIAVIGDFWFAAFTQGRIDGPCFFKSKAARSSPQPKERVDLGQRIEKSLQPNLKWDAFPSLVKDVTYDLRIWRAETGLYQLQQGSVVYERQGITQPSHQIEKPLESSTHFLWAVRAHFKLNDQIQITPWSHEIAAGAPDEPRYYHFWTPTSIGLPQ